MREGVTLWRMQNIHRRVHGCGILNTIMSQDITVNHDKTCCISCICISCSIILEHISTLQWCHNECDGDSNHQHLDCLLKHLFRPRSKKTPKLSVTGLCEGNSPVTCEFPARRASDMENVSIWWHHDFNCQDSPYHVLLGKLHWKHKIVNLKICRHW